MKIYQIIFSPTGGTEKVANIISKELGNDIDVVDLSKPDLKNIKLESDSISIITMPPFGGRAPQIAIDRLKKINGNDSKAIAVAVYGNRAQEDTLLEIFNTAKECGFNVVAGISAIAEHSMINQYANGRPDLEDEEQLKDFVKQIKNNNFNSNSPDIPGNFPYKKHGNGLVPKASSKCVSCGYCVNMCPVRAITKNNPRKTDKKECVNCMRCVSICPQDARKVNKLMLKIVEFALKKACCNPKANELFI